MLLRRLTPDDLSALAGAIAYTYCGYFLWLYTMPAFVNGAVLLPWVFLAVIHTSEPGVRLTTATALVGLTLGPMLLIGQPQIAVLSAMGVGVCGGLTVLLAPSSRCRLVALVALGLGGGLSLLMAGLLLQVLSENLSYTYTLHAAGSYAGERTPALNFVISTFPYVLGQLGSIWRSGLEGRTPNAETFPVIWGTFGLISLALVFGGLTGTIRRRCLGVDRRVLAVLLPGGPDPGIRRGSVGRVHGLRRPAPLEQSQPATVWRADRLARHCGNSDLGSRNTVSGFANDDRGRGGGVRRRGSCMRRAGGPARLRRPRAD